MSTFYYIHWNSEENPIFTSFMWTIFCVYLPTHWKTRNVVKKKRQKWDHRPESCLMSSELWREFIEAETFLLIKLFYTNGTGKNPASFLPDKCRFNFCFISPIHIDWENRWRPLFISHSLFYISTDNIFHSVFVDFVNHQKNNESFLSVSRWGVTIWMGNVLLLIYEVHWSK